MTSNTLSLEKIAARINLSGRQPKLPRPIKPAPSNARLRGAQPKPQAPSGLVPVRSGQQPAPATKSIVRPEDTASLQLSIGNIDASFNPSYTRYREPGPVVNGLRLNELDDMASRRANDPNYTLHATPGARQGVLPGFESYMVAKDKGGGLYNSYPADPVQLFARRYFASEPYLSQASITPPHWRGATAREIDNAIAASALPNAPLTLPSLRSGLRRTLPPLIGGVGAGVGAGLLGRTLYNNFTGSDDPAPTPGGVPVGQPLPLLDPAPAPAPLHPAAVPPSPLLMQAPSTGYTLNPMMY